MPASWRPWPLEEPEHAAAIGFGAIQREIGVLEQLLRRHAVVGCDRHADARPDDDLVARNGIRRGQAVDDARGQRGRARGLVAEGLDHGELVPSEPRHRIAVANATTQAIRGRLEQLIADGVPERVIHRLEPVEVEAEHTDVLAARHAQQCLGQFLLEQHAIGQIGHRIVQRQMADARFGPDRLGDVLMGHDPSAADHGLVVDLNGAAIHQSDAIVRRLVLLADLAHLMAIAVEVGRRLIGARSIGDDLIERCALFGESVRQSIHLGEAPIADDQPALGVEHAQAVRHVVQRGIEALVLLG